MAESDSVTVLIAIALRMAETMREMEHTMAGDERLHAKQNGINEVVMSILGNTPPRFDEKSFVEFLFAKATDWGCADILGDAIHQVLHPA